MRTKDIHPGDTLTLISPNRAYENNPGTWTKVEVLATQAPMPGGISYASLSRHFEPTGVLVCLLPNDPKLWGAYASPKNDRGTSTTTILGWQGVPVTARRGDDDRRAPLPANQLIVPPRLLRPWSDQRIAEIRDAAKAQAERDATRRAQEQATREQLEQLVSKLGLAIVVPRFGSAIRLDQGSLAQILQRLDEAEHPDQER